MTTQFDKFAPYQRAIAKGHLCSCGADYAGLSRPIIAIVNSWNEITAGHAHLRELATHVRRGIVEAGGYPLEFNTIAVCDGITQSHNGMKFVLPSRELITDSIEVMIRAHGIFDGMVLIGSCDKIVPAMLMAAGRLNIPAALVSGGPMVNEISPKESKSARQQFIRGEISEQKLVETTLQYYPTPGICPFLGTANTMCMVAEALGMSLPGSGVVPAQSQARQQLAYDTGAIVLDMVRNGRTPRQIMTKAAFLNSIRVVAAIGGSLNTILHIPAIAHECGVEVDWRDFDTISRTTPLLTRIYPNSNEYTVADLDAPGGITTILHELEPLLDATAITISGQTLRETLAKGHNADGKVIRPLSDPFSPDGGIAVLHGNLAPQGAVVKLSAVPEAMHQFTGPARVFESEEDCMTAAYESRIGPGEAIIIRNEGPVGGPGMREMHRATEVLSRVERVAIITDGRFSGASGGLAIGYLSPEAATGGPISLVRDGDPITIDLAARTLEWLIEPDEIARRQEQFVAFKRNAEESNFLRLYSKTTTASANGTVRKSF